MHRHLALAALLAVAIAAPATAQNTKASGSPAMGGLKQNFDEVRGNIVRAAEQVPADKYDYKPTPKVRSFGQLVAHITDANNAICSAGHPQARPYTDVVEKTVKGKDALVAKLKESMTYCTEAYTNTQDAALGESFQLFGQSTTRAYALSLNLSHAWEHYGNIVTYMRMLDLVPPSSQQ